jgi:hypothetical protein
MLQGIPTVCRYLPVLQLVTLLMTPATAIYAVGGLLASPVLVPAIIIKNLVVLVRVAHLSWLGCQQQCSCYASHVDLTACIVCGVLPTMHCRRGTPALV